MGRVGKTGVGHSYRNKAKGWISGSDGYLSRKSKRRSRDNSFACQVHLCKVPKLWGRGWVSFSRFTDLCHVCLWGLPKHIYLGSFYHFCWVLKVPLFWTGLSTAVQHFCFIIRETNQNVQTIRDKSGFNLQMLGHVRSSFFYPQAMHCHV